VVTADELRQMLPGTTVESTTADGERRWTNEPNGTLVAHFSRLGRGKEVTSTGDWSVSDDGKYCAHIEWRRVTERWCARIQKKAEGKYSLVNDTDVDDVPWRVEITK
jgi:hypothetical protein